MKTRHKTGALAISLIAILFFTSLFSFYSIKKKLELRETISRTLEEFQFEIGFTGLIHNFKNSVIRPNRPEYLDQASKNSQRALELLDRLNSLGVGAGISRELAMLENTRAMINAYTTNLEIVRDGHATGLSITEIDSLVAVDDAPAKREIESYRYAIYNTLDTETTRLTLFASLLSILSAAFILSVILWLNNRRIAALVEKLKLAEQNVELKSFASRAAHDLRNPLSQLATASDLLMIDKGRMPATERRLIAMISEVSEDMLDQVNSLLEYSVNNEREIKKSSLAMKPLIQSVVENLQIKYGKEHRVTIKDMPDVDADPALMKRVWTNLVENSLKYTALEKSAQIFIYGKKEVNLAYFFLEDRGIGIDASNAEEIFEPMTRLHGREARYRGHGIGLAMVRSIVNRHGGRIYLDTSYKKGARFCIELPTE